MFEVQFHFTGIRPNTRLPLEPHFCVLVSSPPPFFNHQFVGLIPCLSIFVWLLIFLFRKITSLTELSLMFCDQLTENAFLPCLKYYPNLAELFAERAERQKNDFIEVQEQDDGPAHEAGEQPPVDEEPRGDGDQEDGVELEPEPQEEVIGEQESDVEKEKHVEETNPIEAVLVDPKAGELDGLETNEDQDGVEPEPEPQEEEESGGVIDRLWTLNLNKETQNETKKRKKRSRDKYLANQWTLLLNLKHLHLGGTYFPPTSFP
jgi:hypothetical protein